MSIKVGDLGASTTTLQPSGFVSINGERLDARAEFGLIPAGTSVVVVSGDHLGLVVRPAGNDSVSDAGKPVCTSYSQRIASESQRVEDERHTQFLEHRRGGTTTSAAVGGLAGIGAAITLWDWVAGQVEQPILAAGGCAAAGFLGGLILFRLVLNQASPGEDVFGKS